MAMNSHNLLLHRTFQWMAVISVLAVLGGGYWYWKNAQAGVEMDDNRPSFEAPLTHDLNLTRGQGSPTYSRSDGADRRATVTDFEGLIRPVKSGEARFEGARRVENRLTYSEAFDNAAWTKTATATLTANTGTAPDGTQTADQLVTTTTSNYQVRQSTTIPKAGEVVTFSIWARQTAGTAASLTMDVNDGIQTNIALASYWQRFSVSGTPGSSSTNVFTDLTFTQTGTYELWGAQLEITTGQANQNPSEYVSVGIKTSAPYHGAGVDGVKYFDTENGNTVTSNVVTEATGAAIPTATLKGYLAEGARTNLLLQSETLGTSWTPSSMTVTTDSTTAPSGKTSAETLAATVENATLIQAVTGTAASYTFSVYLKRLTGVGAVSISADGTNFTVCTVSSSAWIRCTDTRTLTAASYNQTIKIATSGDAIYAWGAQLELATFASSYIPTTTASTGRGTDNLKYVGASNFNDTAGTVTVDVTTEWTGGNGVAAYFIDDSSTYQRMSIWHWNGSTDILNLDRTGGGGTRNNVDYAGSTITAGTIMKLGQRWTSAAHSLFRDGSLRGSDTTLTLPYDAISGISVGLRADVNTPAFSNLKNVRAWKKALTDTELNNLTSLTQATSDSATKKTTIKAPDNTSLVAHWPFEDGSGTRVEDASAAGANSGTLTNGPTWVSGKVGQAVAFDGTDDRIDIPVSANLPGNFFSENNWTISAWVKPTLTGDSAQGIFMGVWHKPRIFTGLTGSLLFSGFVSGVYTNFLSVGNFFLANIWTHFTIVSDGVNYVLYKNGAQVSSTPYIQMDASATTFRIGADGNGDSNLNGMIDEVRVYDRALPQAEIMNLYQTTSSAKLNTSQNSQLTDGLVGLWSFNGPDISGTTAYDRSGQGNNGTLTGGPTAAIGKVGQALRFDGVNDYVNVPNTTNLNPGTGNFTLSAWIRVESTPTDFRRLINKGSGSTFYAFVKFPSDKWKFEFRDGTLSTGDLDFGTSTMTYGNWMHLVATVDHDTGLTTGYLDGVLKDTSSIAGYATVSNTDYLSLGRSSIDAPYSIDEVRVYNRALTTEEVTALYNAGR